MKHPALKILDQIIQEPDMDKRNQLYAAWQKEWIEYVDNEQNVINKSTLSSEETDFIWYHIAKQCADELIEKNIANLESTNTKFSSSLVALRSKNAKLQENTKSNKKTR